MEQDTPPASPAPVQSAPQQLPTPPKKSSLKTVVFIIIVVVIAALSGYATYYVTNTQFEKKLSETVAQNKTLESQVQTLTNQLEEKAKESSSSANSSTENPAWINEWIKKAEASPVANPPATLSKCTYKNQTVYYVPPRCCDIYSDLYNDKGEKICSPGGGITGKGDGKCTDFSESKNECEVIWKDSR